MIAWYYFGARYYDAEVGRFLSCDQFMDKYPSLNPYHYCANNPLLFVDINGDSLDLHQIAKNLNQKASDHQQQSSDNFKKSLDFSVGIAYGGGLKLKAGPLKLSVEAVLMKQEINANLNGNVSFEETSGGGVKLSIRNDVNIGLHSESYTSTNFDNKTTSGTTTTLGVFTDQKGLQLESSNTSIGMNVSAGLMSAGVSVNLKNVGMGLGHQIASYGYSTASKTINALLTIKQITF